MTERKAGRLRCPGSQREIMYCEGGNALNKQGPVLFLPPNPVMITETLAPSLCRLLPDPNDGDGRT